MLEEKFTNFRSDLFINTSVKLRIHSPFSNIYHHIVYVNLIKRKYVFFSIACLLIQKLIKSHEQLFTFILFSKEINNFTDVISYSLDVVKIIKKKCMFSSCFSNRECVHSPSPQRNQ